MTRIRAMVALLAATAAMGAATPASAAPGEPPTGMAVSPVHAPSTRVDRLVPLAGDPTRLIYAQTQVLGDGTTGASELKISDASGHITDIGPVALMESGYARQFSLSGDLLTAADGQPTGFQHVTWWNLADGSTGTSDQVPGEWLGSAPDGWYYASGNAVYDETTGGTARLVAMPFANAGEIVTTGNAGPNGVVVASSAGHVAYVKASGTVTALATAWSGFSYPGDYVFCRGTSDTATLCGRYDESGDGSVPAAAERLPLDGGPAVAAPLLCLGVLRPSAAFVGSTLVCANGTVISQATGGSVQTSTYQVGSGEGASAPQVIPAFGRAVVRTPALNQLETVVDAVTPPTALLSAVPSDATTGDFSLSAGRVVWTTDASFGGVAAPGSSAVEQTALPNTSVWNDPPITSLVSGSTGWKFVFASGLTTAYSKRVAIGGASTWTIVVVSPQRTSTVTNAQRASVSLSGNRMLYRTTRSAAHRHGRFMVLDVTTGKKTPVAALNAALVRNINFEPSALSGPHVAYVDGAAVYRLNVSTGKRKVVANGAVPGDRLLGTQLSVYGPYVGWLTQTKDGSYGPAYYRDIATGAKAVKLPAGLAVLAMTNSGMLLLPLGEVHTVGNGLEVSNAYYLRGYARSATVTQVLSAPGAQSRPQLSDGVLAWIDSDHVLQVSYLDDPVTGNVTVRAAQ